MAVDTTKLQQALALTVQYLDLQMQTRPTQELAEASNTVQLELSKLRRAMGIKL